MISVIIPVYNVENYLNECLDSVYNQKFKDIEIICVNDGSTDNSLEILQNYAKKDSRIKIITQENHGLGHARNTGLKHATGEYVLFVDSDDILCENALEELYNHVSLNDSDVVIFNFFRYNGNVYAPTGIFSDNISEKGNMIDYTKCTFDYKAIKEYVMYDYFAVWFKMYKKEFLDKYELIFPVGIAYEDVLFQVKSFIYADKISFLPKHLYSYRTANSNSLTSDGSKIFDIVTVVDSVEEFLKEMSLYDDFEFEFLMFKIMHYEYKIIVSRGTDYFDFVKKEFIDLEKQS